MKKNLKLLSLIALSLTIMMGACKKTDPSPKDKKLDELQGTWTIASANVLDEAITGVSINFNKSNSTYSVSGFDKFVDLNLNHSEALAASGSFSLNDNLNVITLSPGGDFNISNLNKETGDLSLSYSAPFPKATADATSISLSLKLQ